MLFYASPSRSIRCSIIVAFCATPCPAVPYCFKPCTIVPYRDTLKRKWKWAGHIVRMKGNRWTKRCTKWQTRRGKRSRGRPSGRWQDDIAKKGGNTWNRNKQTEDNGRHWWRATSCSVRTKPRLIFSLYRDILWCRIMSYCPMLCLYPAVWQTLSHYLSYCPVPWHTAC